MAKNTSPEAEDEIECLRSIFGESNVNVSGHIVRLSVPVAVHDPVTICGDVHLSSSHNVVHNLSPIDLTYTLHPAYPSTVSPPATELSAPWLSADQAAALQLELTRLWEEADGGVCAFQWADFLGHEALPLLLLRANGELPDAPASVTPFPHDRPRLHWDTGQAAGRVLRLKGHGGQFQLVIEHDACTESSAWDSSSHYCPACMDTKKGAGCTRLGGCGHVFCVHCVSAHVQARLDEGRLADMPCLETACTFSLSQAEIRCALGSGPAWERYDRLLLERALETMGDVTLCPRAGCGKPAVLEDGPPIAGVTLTPRAGKWDTSGGGGGGGLLPYDSGALLSRGVADSVASVWSTFSRKMGRCSYCTFVFCVECRKSWHGLAPCLDLMTAYRRADEGGKKALRAKYGNAVFDELETAAWVAANTKPCPKCHMAVEKNRGCNHMRCASCGWEFCWLCGGNYVAGHFTWNVTGGCEQFDADYYTEFGFTREEFVRHFINPRYAATGR